MIIIDFQQGTLVIQGSEKELEPVSGLLKFDERINLYRTQAYRYAPIIRTLHERKIPFQDRAKGYNVLDKTVSSPFTPHQYQENALKAWINQQCRGLVVMPTGSGKSFLAVMAMRHVKRSTLVVVPTIDLMQQWAGQLERALNMKVGLLGGGSKDVLDVTVSTYDSAVLMMEFIGNRFGLVIFDECHHLPGPSNRLAAAMSIAPFRLGLTATPERQDDGIDTLYELIGNLCYRKDIDQLEGTILAPYTTERIELELEEDEAEEYQRNRAIYLDFVRANNIDFSSAHGWARFVALSARSPAGQDAFKAYRVQKGIAGSSRAKFGKIWELLRKHAGERILIFTTDNNTAYELGRRYFLPVITHHTKVAERKEFLDGFRSGEYPVLSSSRVLNEGIDVPEASVGIIVSGTGSIREHVQRLGRILRPVAGKQARLYELVSKGTSELNISERRRQHRAYERPGKIQDS